MPVPQLKWKDSTSVTLPVSMYLLVDFTSIKFSGRDKRIWLCFRILLLFFFFVSDLEDN